MNDSARNELRSMSADDGEVERLLGDAYDAPAMPASLVQRVDRLIVQEWGASPGLIADRAAPLRRSLSRGAKWFKAVPVAACAALVIAAVLLFGKGSSAYAWASMVKALEQQGVIQLDGPGVTRWLSLSEGVLSERSGKVHTLIDVRQDVVLERHAGEPQIRRRKLTGERTASERDQLVLAFLLGNATTAASGERLRGAHVIDERWERAKQGERQTVSLNVRWETDRSERFDLHLTLDPVTQLPLASNVSGSELPAASLTWSYPTTRVAELRAYHFPADVAVVDVDDGGTPLVVTTANDATTAPREAGTAPTVAPGTNSVPGHGIAVAMSMTGAASHWNPVVAIPRTRGEAVQQIDAILAELWRKNGVDPAPPADDEELLRRVYLDLTGRTPSVHEIRTYLADKSPDRYALLVDRLLQNRDHASHLATIWRTFLIPDGVDLTAFGGVDAFDRWLTEQFGDHEPYDRIVRKLLLAEGRLSRSGPLLFYSAAKLDPDQLAARSARVFLGMRLECAQCHNHPFEPWTQEDFWSLAAFFAQISRPQGELQAASTVMQVKDINRGEVKLPKTETIIPPRFLNHSGNRTVEASESRRQQLAQWLTAAENPYFSRATANRVWSLMFGKGIVDPVDDFGTQHPAKSPLLLDLLAGHLANSQFDLRELFRAIALSRAYRLSSGAATADPHRVEWFAQMNVKTFSAEQVYDCMTVAALLDTAPTADPYSFNIARYGNSDRELFLQQFRTPAGRSTEYLGGIPQALTLMNGKLIEDATGLSSSGLLKSLEAPFFTNKQRIEVLYLAALSRHPRPAEWDVLNGYVSSQAKGSELQESLADILWALLNSAEFTMNH
ncbi:MAG TPA: DUF1549 domain-containing protein [Planctomycetaceae bacterium]|nr:DUF1549 domain-containing protein [Planctomycetaceae bacterium]